MQLKENKTKVKCIIYRKLYPSLPTANPSIGFKHTQVWMVYHLKIRRCISTTYVIINHVLKYVPQLIKLCL